MKNWHLLTLTVIGAVFWGSSADAAASKRCNCFVSGDPHYYLFDGQVIHFMGTCKYILAANKPGSNMTYFAVEVKNEHRGSTRVSYTRMVDVKLTGITIRLLPNNKILVNLIKMNLPVVGFQYSASYSAGWITITTKWGLRLSFDGNHMVYLTLPGSFANQLTGICGDCNGVKDDFKTRSGEDVSKRKNKYAVIGDSYQVCDDSDKPKKCENREPENNCSPTQVKKCDIIGSKLFEPCAKKIGQKKLSRHMESCKIDICAYLKQPTLQSVLCKVLESVTNECEEADVFIDWRKTANCKKECPLNQEYKHKTPACQPTCSNQSPSCKKYTEGCICKSGYVLSGEKCVPESQCGCMDGKIYMMLYEELYGEKCLSKTKCNANGKIERTKTNGCQTDSKCVLYNNKRACVCNPGYVLENGKCLKFVCDKPVDIQFMLESGSIGKVNFEELKRFVSSFLDLFTINLYSTRWSIHTFWSTSRAFNLKNSDDPVKIMNVFEGLKYSNRNDTSLYHILYYLNNYKKHMKFRYPIKSHSILVIFVGSKLRYETQTKNIAKTLNRAGFNIYLVGVGKNVDKAQLKNIMSQSNASNLMFTENFHNLNNIKSQLVQKMCSVDPCKQKPNPCKNGGKCINKNSTFICQCTNNYFGRFCAQVKKCSCYNYEELYYWTFDGQSIQFKGGCKYNMVSGKSGSTTFSVDVHNEPQNLVKAYQPAKRAVVITINSITIRLLPLQRITVNEEEFNLPIVKYREFDAYLATGWVVFTTKWGLVLKYDGQHRVIVSLPISFANKLTGICGNCNGKKDDLRTKSGRDVSSLKDRDSLIADSYQIIDNSKEKCKATHIVTNTCNSTQMQRCNIIYSNIFKPCLQTVGKKLASQYLESCQSAVCESNDIFHNNISFCKHIEAFVTECERHGATINWRGNAGCPKLCKWHEAYQYHATNCQNDCVKTTKCSTYSEGCVCGTNLYYSGTHCGSKSSCGCIIKKQYVQLGHSSLDSTCKKRYYCQKPGQYKTYSHSCRSKQSKCGLKNGKRDCICSKGYYGSHNCYSIGRQTFITVTRAELKTIAWTSYSAQYHYQCYYACNYNKQCKAFSYDHSQNLCEIYNVDASGNFSLTPSHCSSKHYYQRNSKSNIIINGASLNYCGTSMSMANVKNKEECKNICVKKGCYAVDFLKSKKVCRMLMSFNGNFYLVANEDSEFVGYPTNELK